MRLPNSAARRIFLMALVYCASHFLGYGVAAAASGLLGTGGESPDLEEPVAPLASSVPGSGALELVALAPEPAPGRVLARGEASWYGPGFHGRRTASGEIFDQEAMTAAMLHVRLGTRVRVTNLANGRSVVLRVNDRGPYVGGRVIDLSRGAMRALGGLSAGVIEVRVEAL